MTPKNLSAHFQWRTKFLRASSEFTLATAGPSGAALREVEQSLVALATSVPPSDVPAVAVMQQLNGATAGFSEWVAARAAGAADVDRHWTAAQTAVAIAQESLSKVPQPDFKEAATKCLLALAAIVNVTDVAPALKSATAIPFPPCLDEHKVPTVPSSETPMTPPAKKAVLSGPLAIRVMLTVDSKPWANPQMLHPGTVYDVAVVATVPTWPEDSDTLVLDYITTLPGEVYRITRFNFTKPGKGENQELRAKGYVEFQSSQSFLSEPALLQMRATFRSSTNEKMATPATVIGYHKLRARIMDPKLSPHLSKYRALDLKLSEIIDHVRDLPGLDPQHLEDFITLLAAVANYLGLCAQTAVYRAGESIPEKDFQKQLLIHLRSILGEEVQEAPKQGAGITDIKFRSVTTELKVETTIADRAKMVAAYESQTTQYSSSLGAQLGILCVLDLTEKDAPPAPTQNNMIVMTPKLHGFGDKAPSPSRVVAAIIDGNLRAPSSYSR
jgi:translation elongation factor P/translation initiation factor 5A